MVDYELLYWSVPFRGQFVRAVLAFAGKSWTEAGDDAIAAFMDGPVSTMPVPFMGPPVLIDKRSNVAISQMPAIVLYLGETLDLLPSTPYLRALTSKVVNDANDVIDEMSLNGGRDMWTEQRWLDFIPRIQKWMTLWEDLGRRHGLQFEDGYLLGGDAPGLADVITATLWCTLSERFGRIKALLEETAPMTAALSRRVASIASLTQLAQQARLDYGKNYSGGQIGASMAKVLGDPPTMR